MFDVWVLVLLAGVGAFAGFVDAVAGGGGLIALPALMATGMSPVNALATNKAQSVVGTFAAAYTYWKKGFVKVQDLILAIILTFIGSYSGAFVVKNIDTSALSIAVPIAVITVAVYFIFSPSVKDEDVFARLNFKIFVPILGLIMGFYDGIFGPGTGSFYMLGFVALFGFAAAKASAHTKVLNVTSNLAALALFIPAGDVLWPAAAAMAVGQLAGGYLGALTGIKYGAKIIRPLVIGVSVVLAIKLLFFP